MPCWLSRILAPGNRQSDEQSSTPLSRPQPVTPTDTSSKKVSAKPITSGNMAYEQSLSFVLSWEGGFSDDYRDPGGKTAFGLTQRDYPELWDRDKTPRREDAHYIYKRDFWDAVDGDAWPEPVALMVFDAAVNCGAHRAVKFLQRAAEAHPDGIIGPRTRYAVKKMWATNPERLLRDMAAERITYYGLLDHLDDVFLRGWARRTCDCLLTAMKGLD